MCSILSFHHRAIRTLPFHFFLLIYTMFKFAYANLSGFLHLIYFGECEWFNIIWRLRIILVQMKAICRLGNISGLPESDHDHPREPSWAWQIPISQFDSQKIESVYRHDVLLSLACDVGVGMFFYRCTKNHKCAQHVCRVSKFKRLWRRHTLPGSRQTAVCVDMKGASGTINARR